MLDQNLAQEVVPMKLSMTSRSRVVLFAIVVFAVTSCTTGQSSDTTTPGGDPVSPADVTVDNFAFTPASITVAAGETVSWTNEQSVGHTVTSSDDVWDASLDGGGTFEFTFTASGTYPYFCAIHPSMTGTVEVTE